MDRKDFMKKLAASCEISRKAHQAYLASPEYQALQKGLERFGETLKGIYMVADFDTMLGAEKLNLLDDLEHANSPEAVEDLQLAKQELERAEHVLDLVRNHQDGYRNFVAAGISKKDLRKDGTVFDAFRAFLYSQQRRLKIYIESPPSPAQLKIYRLRKDILKKLEQQYKLMQRDALGLGQ